MEGVYRDDVIVSSFWVSLYSRKIVLEFLEFRKIVSTFIIKVIYTLGLIALIFGGIGGLVSGEEELMLIGLGVITVGNLLWRVVCEGLVLLFSIHDILGSIEKTLKKEQLD